MTGIKLFVTGGTFDKEYNELKGELFFRETHIHEMLTLGRSRLRIDVETLMMIDSLYMKEEHRKQILDACNNAKQNNILITHGT